jgi:hypothetical protein
VESAAQNPQWTEQIRSNQICLTAFNDPAVLTAVVPVVLPLLTEAVWMQMGPTREDVTSSLSAAAQRRGVRFLSAPLNWGPDGWLLRIGGPLETSQDSDHFDESLLYGLTLAALTEPGLGLEPPLEMTAETANVLARLEQEFTTALPRRKANVRRSPVAIALEPLSEGDLAAELEARGLADAGRGSAPAATQQEKRNSMTAIPDSFGFALSHIDDASPEELAPGIQRQKLLDRGPVSGWVYTFAPGASAGPDLHDNRFETGWILDGELEDERYRYPQGTFFVADPNSLHHPRAPRGAKRIPR